MAEETFTHQSLQPKPYVFVLMPFGKEFRDIYQFGIKGAAEDAGAYAERLDDQIFTDGILDRIFNQINRADVIVADMTGRNANVFYEVGYAHALGKLVLLLTKDAEDIPFDLKHRQHVVYDSIDTLRRDLAPRVAWAIREGASRRTPTTRTLRVTLSGVELSPGAAKGSIPSIPFDVEEWFDLPLAIWNESPNMTTAFSHVYLFAESGSAVVPYQNEKATLSRITEHGSFGAGGSFSAPKYEHYEGLTKKFITSYRAADPDAPDGLNEQYRLSNSIASIPPGAVEHDVLRLGNREGIADGYIGTFRLRLHGNDGIFDFSFRLAPISTPAATT
ncbi:MAG TPA: nucleoside 2-deoxyribosyltransferase [Thermoanaerobaculia bacterium]